MTLLDWVETHGFPRGRSAVRQSILKVEQQTLPLLFLPQQQQTRSLSFIHEAFHPSFFQPSLKVSVALVQHHQLVPGR